MLFDSLIKHELTDNLRIVKQIETLGDYETFTSISKTTILVERRCTDSKNKMEWCCIYELNYRQYENKEIISVEETGSLDSLTRFEKLDMLKEIFKNVK